MPQYQTYPSKPSPDAGDIFLILDPADLTDSSEGTTKRTTVGAVAGHGHSGFSVTLGQYLDTASLQASVDALVAISYTPPTITLTASPAPTLREKGDPVATVALVAVTLRRSDALSAVAFYRDGVLLGNVAEPQAQGGMETFTDNGAFSDTVTYTATASDGTATVTSDAVSYRFVYPYYFGVGAADLTAVQVAGLTKAIIAQAPSKAVTTSPSGEVFYFAYPAAYGALSSITDTNGFETLADYTQRSATITGLDGTAQAYFIYEFNQPTSQTLFTNTYTL